MTMHRWIFLALSSLAYFFAELCVEQSAPLVSRLCGTAEACRNGTDPSCLQFTATEFNGLFVAHFWAGGIAALSTGFFLGRYGVWIVSCATAVLLFVGLLLFTIGPYMPTVTGAFWIMVVGRVIFSAGYFGQIALSHQVKSHWFFGKELGLAFSIHVDCSRVGSLVCMAAVGAIVERIGLQSTLWATFGLSLLSPVCAIAAGWVYHEYAALSITSAHVDHGKPGEFGFRKLTQLSREFWIIAGMIFFFFSAFLTALADFPKFLTEIFANKEAAAGQITGIIPDIAIFAPPFGFLIDRFGGRDILNLLASAIFFIGFLGIAADPIYHSSLAILCAVCMGTTMAIVGASSWGSIPLVVNANVVGVAMSVSVCVQALGSGLLLLIGGLVLDQTSLSMMERWKNFFILMASLAGMAFLLAGTSMYYDYKNPLRPLRYKHTIPAAAVEMNPDVQDVEERLSTTESSESSPLIRSHESNDKSRKRSALLYSPILT